MTTFSGALVRKTAPQTSVTAAALTWDAEVYDTDAYHDNVTNNTRLTVPSDGLYRVSASADAHTDVRIYLNKNALSFRGMLHVDGSSVSSQSVHGSSAIISCTAGDYFETQIVLTSSNSVENGGRTWMSIEKLDAATKYALVYKTATQAISAGVATILSWQAETADTDAWHDNTTNNSRLTVPSGVTRVRVSANIAGGSVTGDMKLAILKNGASARGLSASDTASSGSEHVNVVSAILDVVAGDYFEVQATSSASTSITNDERAWFCIEEVPDNTRALVYKSGNQTFAQSVNTAVEFGAEVYDASGLHDNTTNNSRITVPAGSTYARPVFGFITPNVTAQQVVNVTLNGSDYYGAPQAENDTQGVDHRCGFGAWVPVSPGDYFELVFYTDTTGGLTATDDNGTYLGLEVISTATNYSLTADAGSYTLTGIAATRGFRLSAEAGAYVLTGFAAGGLIGASVTFSGEGVLDAEASDFWTCANVTPTSWACSDPTSTTWTETSPTATTWTCN
jgi:hypothetical protein